MKFGKEKIKFSKQVVIIILIIVLVLCGSAFFFLRSRGEERKATVTLQVKEKLEVGKQVTVPLFIDTLQDTMNAAEVYITFNPAQIKVDSVSRDGSIFKIWIKDQPSFSNEKGEINFAGGLPKPGFKGVGQIGTVTLTLLQKTSAQLTFTEKTRILKNDGLGTFVPLRLDPVTIQAK